MKKTNLDNFLLSVVIPSYNEMGNLQKGTLDKVEHYLEKNKFNYEVLVVDDGSTDGSLEFVKKFSRENPKFKVVENNHTGKAGAVTAGVLKAAGDYILFTDMDQATPIEEIEKLLPFIKAMPAGRQEFDIVIGSRNNTRRGAPFSRKLMAKGMIILRSLLVGFPEIKDTQCGFKLFTKKSAREIFEKMLNLHGGFKSIKNSSVTAGFDVELLYIGTRLGYKIKEVPVEWLYVETRRVNPIKDSLDGFLDLVRIRGRILKGRYG